MNNVNARGCALFVLVISLLFHQAALAQSATADRALFNQCLQAADEDPAGDRNRCIGEASAACIGQFFTASGKATCSSLETALWDERLNMVYQDLRAGNRPGALRDAVRTTQRAWIAFRDADCGLYRAMGIGGAPEAQLFESCLLEHTARRANALFELARIADEVGR